MADYMTTYSGTHFYPTDPVKEDIHIRDIAHALSLLCRGNGQVTHFFSVGQHCINCCLEAEARGYSPRLVLACLLHDGAEAYMADLIRPIKNGMSGYREMEDRLLNSIYEKYLGSTLSEEEQTLVKKIDDDMCYYDVRNLLREPMEQPEPVMVRTFSQEFVPFEEVEQSYMELFDKWIKQL